MDPLLLLHVNLNLQDGNQKWNVDWKKLSVFSSSQILFLLQTNHLVLTIYGGLVFFFFLKKETSLEFSFN